MILWKLVQKRKEIDDLRNRAEINTNNFQRTRLMARCLKLRDKKRLPEIMLEAIGITITAVSATVFVQLNSSMTGSTKIFIIWKLLNYLYSFLFNPILVQFRFKFHLIDFQWFTFTSFLCFYIIEWNQFLEGMKHKILERCLVTTKRLKEERKRGNLQFDGKWQSSLLKSIWHSSVIGLIFRKRFFSFR